MGIQIIKNTNEFKGYKNPATDQSHNP